jgi:hypothetical protein
LIRQKLQSCSGHRSSLVEHQKPPHEQNITSFLELQGVPFTGCGSTGMTLCKHKGISKKILITIGFACGVRHCLGAGLLRPKRLASGFVKPLRRKLPTASPRPPSWRMTNVQAAVAFILKIQSGSHRRECIEGRELYVSLLGNHRLQVLPIRGSFREVPTTNRSLPATKPSGTRNIEALGHPEFANGLIGARPADRTTCKKIYRLLAIDASPAGPAPPRKMNWSSSKPIPIVLATRRISRSPRKPAFPIPNHRKDHQPGKNGRPQLNRLTDSILATNGGLLVCDVGRSINFKIPRASESPAQQRLGLLVFCFCASMMASASRSAFSSRRLISISASPFSGS